LPTPFDPSGRELLPDRLQHLARMLLGAGITVFLPAAANGEFHSLTDAEILECVRRTKEAVGDDGLVVAPIGFAETRSITLARGALDRGADALLYMPPTHPYLSDAGFGAMVRSIASAVAAPLMLYRKGLCPSDALLARLLGEGVIAGIKYSGSDPEAVLRLISEVGGSERVICGFGERMAPYYGLSGANGFSSGAANVAPRISLRLLQQMLSGAYADAMATLALLRPLEDFRARDGDSYNITGLKGAMRCVGLDFGPARSPQRILTAGEEAELDGIVATLYAAERALAA
jgi:4-hydroxy-tetrahydrodipicolinate synthase